VGQGHRRDEARVADYTMESYERTSLDVEYQTGDKVDSPSPKIEKGKTTEKLLPRWKGTYEVLKQETESSYKVRSLVNDKEMVVHVQHVSVQTLERRALA